MKTLHYDDLDIVGFGGIRENILVMDESVFGHRRHESAWQGFLDLTYFAHAFFKPFGETGLHHHDTVDIISVITKGPITHQGTMIPGQHINTGQALIQTSGPSAFQHNEMNDSDAVKGMIQIWMKPSAATQRVQDSTIVDINESGITPIYGHEPNSSETKVSVLVLRPNETFFIQNLSRAYLYLGSGVITSTADKSGKNVSRGTLIEGEGLTLNSEQESRWIIISSEEPALK